MRRISDTSLVRDYCHANTGGLLDLNYVSKTIFKDIPEQNLRKIATRLIDSGLLRQISKGVYLIGDSTLSDEERIINHYLFDRGVRVGMPINDYLLFELGLIEEKPSILEIKTNRTFGNKNIGNIQIGQTKSTIAEGVLQTYDIEIALDLMENMYRMDPLITPKAKEIVKKILTDCYMDFRFTQLEMDRPRKVYLELANLLDSLNISNKVLDIYVSKTRLQS